MSLLTIVQETLKEIGSSEIPVSVVGNSNETAVRSLALCNRSLRETAKRLKWTGITVRGTFNTVASQEEYALPSDFFYLINQTLWDDTNNRRVNGPVSPQDWEILKNRVTSGSSLSRFFRIFRGSVSNDEQFYIHPIPDAVATLNFEYRSNALTQTSGGTLQGTSFLADTDTSLLDEDTIALGFKWRFLKTNGLPYAEEFRDYEASVDINISATGAPIIDIGGGVFFAPIPFPPEGNFGL